ncbi:radical SAM protein, partial [bacterium]|nr:radical SAM protein [bacterium]
RSGVRELLVISQDTSAYGVDLKYAAHEWREQSVKTRMTELCQALSQLSSPLNPVWIRLHYVYPYPHVDEVIPLMAQGLITPYLDIPFQHASPRILKLMKRPAHAEKVLERILRWREICPELTIRSTFIVGFPGETEAEFQELLDFLQAAQLDRVGCFMYSPVTGAKANDLPDPVPPEVQQARLDRFMALQAKISQKRLKRKVGTEQRVLIDAFDARKQVYQGRSSADAPEIDGRVIVHSEKPLKIGQFTTVRIEKSGKHDLSGVVV